MAAPARVNAPTVARAAALPERSNMAVVEAPAAFQHAEHVKRGHITTCRMYNRGFEVADPPGGKERVEYRAHWFPDGAPDQNIQGADLQAKPATWENATLDRYLSALERWLEDADGYYRNQGRNVPSNPTWRDVAEMLIAATMYE